MSIKLVAVLISFLVKFSVVYASALNVTVPVLSYRAAAFDYQYRLLEFALEKSGYKYQLKKVKLDTSQARLEKMLNKGDQVNVYWMGTSIEKEKQLTPVRIPILRGLLGHRVFIIHKQDQEQFNQIKTIDDLKKMVAVQGIGWSDIKILKNAGLNTIAKKYKTIFDIINAGGRVDYFPRGVNEAWDEVEQFKKTSPNITVESKILLVYPFAIFFFVSPNHPEIAQALTEGLTKSYKDGSFMEFFNNHPSIVALFEKANIEGRMKLVISNPLMSQETMSIPDEYWHTKQ
ncbi:hypothetical protein H0A36_17750 [Endozoicomonas sp. SM1973]|uniref:Solute-binding protein family 3/N-terminal domain-containing protein n=1 Tax=Spartinivicinus marinus TaxID=2994442 RepID=A0A853I820_9GAMM|nr:hypothetical protein [Spartinivicinus marinus]MCX4025962.1 hypothetical protein [Spartinivicinus marinus]NYZ67862.1 hypothetical protein [Spartinivicinus marinus]